MGGKLRGVLQQVVVAAAAWAITSGGALGAWLAPCTTARLVASWKHDGLWRTAAIADQKHGGHQVRYLGKLHAGSRVYKAYYDVNDDPTMESPQGHQDIVVTTARGKFLGLYDVDSAPPVRTEGADILFDAKGKSGDRIQFGVNGPPEQVFVVSDLFHFNTPAEYRKDFPNEKTWPEPSPRIARYCRR